MTKMARLEDLPEDLRPYIENLECPRYDTRPWVDGPPLRERRVAMISTAGLQCRGDRPYAHDAIDYRVIPGDVLANDLVMSHISTNFDRTGFQQDYNVVFPLDRLRELVEEGVIGSLADYHYSFMGSTTPDRFEPTVEKLVPILKGDGVNAVLLIPV